MKSLHPKIEALRRSTAGQFLTSRYVDQKTLAVRGSGFPVPPGPNEVDAYVALFGVRDSYGTVAVKGCFAKSIQERGPESSANEKIIHLWMHQRTEPVGSLTMMLEDDFGLLVRIKFDAEAGGMPLRIYKQTKSGTVRQYSYGFEYIWDKMEYDDKTESILMLECRLFETTSASILSSNPEAYTVRTKEDVADVLAALGEEVDEALKGLAVRKQMELRQIVSQYKTLAERVAPVEPQPPTNPKPGELAIGEYKLDVKQFKN